MPPSCRRLKHLGQQSIPAALKSLSQITSLLNYYANMISCNNNDPRTIAIESNQIIFLPTPPSGVTAHGTVFKGSLLRDLIETQE